FGDPDEFNWTLEKWDGNGWTVVDQGTRNSGSATTISVDELLGKGTYRFIFEVNNRTTDWYFGDYTVEIDNIRKTASSDPAHWVPQTKVDSVSTAEELDLGLVGAGAELEPTPGGHDKLSGGAGEDIIFRDVMNTDNLPRGVDGTPAKPEG